MVQKKLLHTLFAQNWSDRKINKATGIHRATISRYRKEWQQSRQEKPPDKGSLSAEDSVQNPTHDAAESVPPGQNKVPTDEVVHFEVPTEPQNDNQNATSRSKAAAYHDIICQKLDAGQQARSIFQDLVIEQDYPHSYDSIKRYIRKLKAKHPKLYARLETPPGEEAQVDFGKGAPTLKNGRWCKPWLFVMTLSHSRHSYQEVVWQQDVETFVACHQRAFEYFGGAPKVIKLDNLKSGVLKAHLYEPELNPNYLAFAQHYGFAPLPCKVRMPQHKGKVESAIKYVQNNALKGKQFETLDAQSRHLRAWNKAWASCRIHGTVKRQVKVMFEEEKTALQPLPQSPFMFFKIGTRKVNSLDSHIEIGGAFYPVPPKYMGRRVTVHYNSEWVKVYYQNELIQRLSTISKGRFHPDKSCLPEYKNWSRNKYVEFLFEQCLQIGAAVHKWAKLAEAERQQRAYRSIKGVVSLAKAYPHAVINQACSKCIEAQVFSYHLVQKHAEAIRIQKQIQQEIQFTQESDIIRSPDEYQSLFGGGQ